MFGGQKVILIFYTTCAEDKKLSCGSVGDNNLGFCPVPWHPVYQVPGTVLKSNTVQLKLSCPVPYFLTNQTPPLVYAFLIMF
jgi:hypothetical protein